MCFCGGAIWQGPRYVYKMADGMYVALSGSMQRMAERLFRRVGHDDMNHDPCYGINTTNASNAARVAYRDEVDRIVGNWIA